MKGLFILTGECFRLGGQNSRTRDAPESFQEQQKACKSHVKFFKYIKEKFSIDSECFINTYNTIYKNQLLDWYKDYHLIDYKFNDNLIGRDGLYENSIDILKHKLEEYDFIYFIRIDLYLKEYFSKSFKINIDKIVYSSICFIPYHEYNNLPRVSDLMVYVPKKFYDLLIKKIHILCHEGWYNIQHEEGMDCKKDVTFIIKTYHDSDSAKDWNPLYYIVNREESKQWKSIGYEFDEKTLKPIQNNCHYEKDCDSILGYNLI